MRPTPTGEGRKSIVRYVESCGYGRIHISEWEFDAQKVSLREK